jgi:hypothetical protein
MTTPTARRFPTAKLLAANIAKLRRAASDWPAKSENAHAAHSALIKQRIGPRNDLTNKLIEQIKSCVIGHVKI